MAQLPAPFDPSEVPEDERSFDPIPAGDYQMQVIESKIEDTKSGSGQMLTLTLEVIDGPYANRRIWDRLNIQNQNPDAQRIAQRALADLCLQLDLVELADSEELHFKPFWAKVTVQADKSGQYGPSNRVRYSGGAAEAQPPAGQKAPRAAVSAARAPAAAPAARPAVGRPGAAGAKPWARAAKAPF